MKPIDGNIGAKTGIADKAAERPSETAPLRDNEGARIRGEQAGAQEARPAGESVTLTRAAEGLRELETSLRDAPGVDQARVDELRQAIAEGRYAVDPQRIVDNLLRRESELFR
jgi:negative regulator of flagellin synthesis FlgM